MMRRKRFLSVRAKKGSFDLWSFMFELYMSLCLILWDEAHQSSTHAIWLSCVKHGKRRNMKQRIILVVTENHDSCHNQ